MILLLVALGVSVVVSYVAFRKNENSDVFPKSITAITPFSAIEPGYYSGTQTSPGHYYVDVNPIGVLANTWFIFVSIEFIWGLVRIRLESSPNAGTSHRKAA